MQIPCIPFKILAMASFVPEGHPTWHTGPLRVERLEFDRAIDALQPTLSIPIPRQWYPLENLEIKIRKLKDFHLDGLIQTIPFLKNICEAKDYGQESGKKGLSADEINSGLRQWPDLPPIKIEQTPKRPSHPRNSVDSILEMVDLEDSSGGDATKSKDGITQLEDLLQNILKSVFLNDTFRTLESCWRGLKLLLQHFNQSADVAVEIVPVQDDTLE